MEKELQEFRAVISELVVQIHIQNESIAAKDAQIAALTEQVAKLTAWIEELTHKKNSKKMNK